MMLTIIQEVGPASWHKNCLKTDDDEAKVLQILGQLENGVFWLSQKKKQLKKVDCIKEYGNKLLENKQYDKARETFFFACKISESIKNFNKTGISLLYSSVALCFLKLDGPISAMIMLQKALDYNLYNMEAHLLVISSLYMMYYFEDAMKVVLSCLTRNPEHKELLLFKKRLLKNTIKQKFSDFVIQKRLEVIRTKSLKDFTKQQMMEDILIELPQFVKSVKENKGPECLMLAKSLFEKMYTTMDYFMSLDFYDAHKCLIDLYYVIHFLQETHREKLDDAKLCQFHLNRGKCFYYMENFVDALKCCGTARHHATSNHVELLILEANTYLKLNRHSKAMETIKNCIKTVEANSVEALMCQEVLFEIEFQIDIHDCSLSDAPKTKP